MSKENAFFIYLLERYAEYKNLSAQAVLSHWDKLGITGMIFEMYEMYHVERLENAFMDIDKLIRENPIAF